MKSFLIVLVAILFFAAGANTAFSAPKKITEYDAAESTADNDVLVGVDVSGGGGSGTTKKWPFSVIWDYIESKIPFAINCSVVDPASGDIFYYKINSAITISSIGAIVDPEGSSESVVVDVQECDSNGDNCSSILSSTITAANTPTAGTVSDSSIASGAFLRISLGTVTGTVKTVSIYGVGSY